MNSKSQQLIAGVGNAIVDVLCNIEDNTLEKLQLQKGSMKLCSAEFHNRILNETSNYEISPGGSVANSIATLSLLGINTNFSATIGEDIWGNSFKQSLLDCGIDLNIEIHPDLPTGKSIVLITPDGERTMNTCLGASTVNSTDYYQSEVVIDSQYIFIEGYLLDSDSAWNFLKNALPTYKNRGIKLILTLSDSNCVRDNLSRFKTLAEHCTIIFANSKEIAALWSIEEIEVDFSTPISDTTPYTLVVTRSEMGATIFDFGEVQSYRAKMVTDICDLTGAGDQFASGYIFGYLSGWDIEYCTKFGNELASKIITQIGPRFSSKSTQTILSDFKGRNKLPN